MPHPDLNLALLLVETKDLANPEILLFLFRGLISVVWFVRYEVPDEKQVLAVSLCTPLLPGAVLCGLILKHGVLGQLE